MTGKELAKAYEFQEIEARWRTFWVEQNSFIPDLEAEGTPYCIVIPPPNVTGQLHIGHALNITLQDILCRYYRQKGRKVLWVPGMDHAGIATQNVVERKLAKEGKKREDLGREKFVEEVWAWKKEYGGKIQNQIKHLGASVDWTRERFTMDEGLSKAVRKVFVSLYNEGLIYQGDYIINWCNRCHTALADDEVEHSQQDGKLYHIRYNVTVGEGSVIIATTRPETLLADTAVAVHPEDERYTGLVGKYVLLPVVERELPVIGDSYVDREFGTGCLKVTPGHDMNDWEIGQRHKLDVISVFDDTGHVNANAPKAFQGLSILEAREKIVAMLQEAGYLEKIEEHPHNVGECYRCKEVVEPLVSRQWFVSVEPLAAKAAEAVRTGKTKLYPASWEKTYFHWLDNIRDWCISRQLWWGHRIPVWDCPVCGHRIVDMEAPQACPVCSGNMFQDKDVLDTWFSSALWPFSTLGWPDNTKDLQIFYPTSCLSTGFDILFFWVARMMMMGIHFMDEVPFKDVYIHALVRDGQGKKMSKSTGNVIDPLDMCDTYGTDSLRFTLTAMAAMGRDIKLSESTIEGYRHFMNKLWNAARFSLMYLEKEATITELPKDAALCHHWFLSRLETLKQDMTTYLGSYRFNDAAKAIYNFTWHAFCDWYLELVKADLNSKDKEIKATAQAVLYTGLEEILILAHPIIPFITQQIYTFLPGKEYKDLATALYPESRPHCVDKKAEKEMNLVQDIIVSIRTIRAELNIKPSLQLSLFIKATDESQALFIKAHGKSIKNLARVGEMTVGTEVEAPKASASDVVEGQQIFVPLAGAVDFEAELDRLEKETTKLEKTLHGTTQKLKNAGFVAKAPQEVVEGERQKAKELTEKLEKLNSLHEKLRSAAS